MVRFLNILAVFKPNHSLIGHFSTIWAMYQQPGIWIPIVNAINFFFRRNNLLPRTRCGCQPPAIRATTWQPSRRIQLWLLADVEHLQTRPWIRIFIRRRWTDISIDVKKWRVTVVTTCDVIRLLGTGKWSPELLLRVGGKRRERLWHHGGEVGAVEQ